MIERLDAVLEHVGDRRAAVAALTQLGGALDDLAAERLGKAAR